MPPDFRVEKVGEARENAENSSGSRSGQGAGNCGKQSKLKVLPPHIYPIELYHWFRSPPLPSNRTTAPNGQGSAPGWWGSARSCRPPPPPLPPQVTASSVELHYRSKRPGLSSWVVGICEKVAADFYGMAVEFKLLRGRDDGSCDHEVRYSMAVGFTLLRGRDDGSCDHEVNAGVEVAAPSLFHTLYNAHLYYRYGTSASPSSRPISPWRSPCMSTLPVFTPFPYHHAGVARQLPRAAGLYLRCVGPGGTIGGNAVHPGAVAVLLPLPLPPAHRPGHAAGAGVYITVCVCVGGGGRGTPPPCPYRLWSQYAPPLSHLLRSQCALPPLGGQWAAPRHPRRLRSQFPCQRPFQGGLGGGVWEHGVPCPICGGVKVWTCHSILILPPPHIDLCPLHWLGLCRPLLPRQRLLPAEH